MTKSVQLDLRTNGHLDGTEAEIYNTISNEIRSEFADFVGSLLPDTGELNLDWWLEAPASRNQVFSRLFHQIVAILTLERLLEKGQVPNSVLVDSVEMASVVSSLLGDAGINLPIRHPDGLARLGGQVRSVLSPFRSMIRLFLEWTVVRSTARPKAQVSSFDGPLVLIDTFAIPGFVDTDRYYPGLYEHAGELQQTVRFVPQFFNMKLYELLAASRVLRTHVNKYLLKEDYLTFSDMVWCFGHLYRLGKLEIPECVFRGHKIGLLVKADIKKRAAFRCALRGLMNYRFAERMKNHGVRISKSIDWFENHPMDRGWNAGFNTFFPETKRVGYTGFYPAGQSYRPTVHEYNAGVLPPKHLLLGDGFRDDLREFYPDCRIGTAPAFRYQHLPRLELRKPVSDLILVAMPYYREMCSLIVSIIAELQKKQQKWRFILKPHPAQPIEDIEGFNQIIERNAELTNKPISDWLNRCAVMLTGAQASTILEAAACAVPTIIIAESVSSGIISIPDAIPAEMYETCASAEDAEAAILGLQHSDESKKSSWIETASKFRDLCFLPVTNQTVSKMLLD